MVDYRWLEALAAVIDEGGFDRAGASLGLTQSAVSQRLRQLEDWAGARLVLRESPPRPTAEGQRWLTHFRQVRALEAEVRGQPGTETLALAVNEDSLSTWFLGALLPVLHRRQFLIDLKVDDQTLTLGHLRAGTVAACISSHPDPVAGCVVRPLGAMEYRLCAAPEFRERWFSAGFTAESAGLAPIVHYGRDDDLQRTALALCFGSGAPVPPAHYLPSTERIFDLVLGGLTYAMVPVLQAQPSLDSGRLVELDPRGRVSVGLYWHRWRVSTALVDEVEAEVLAQARFLFAPVV